MRYLGDYAEDYTDFNFDFTSRGIGGRPSSLSGGIVTTYKSNGTTSLNITVFTADFDALTGNNHVNIDLSSDSFYEAGNDYQIILSAGTVGGVDVTGEVLAHFSIENRFDEKNLTSINGYAIQGAGTSGDKWRAV